MQYGIVIAINAGVVNEINTIFSVNSVVVFVL